MANGRPATLRVDIIGNARRAVRAVEQFTDKVEQSTRRVRRAGRTMAASLAITTAAAGGIGAAFAAAGAAIAAATGGAVLALGGLGIAAAAQAEEVQSAFSGIGDGIRDAINEASAAYVPLLVNFGEELRAVLDGPVSDALSRGIEAALPAVQLLLNNAAGIIESLVPVFDQVVAAGEPFALLLSSTLVGALQQIIPTLGPFLAALVDLGSAILPPLLTVLTDVATQLLTALTPAIIAITPSLPPLFEALGQLLVALVPLIPSVIQLAGVLVPVVTVVVSLAAQLVGFLVPAISAVVGWLTSLQPATSSVSGPLDRVRSAADRLASIWRERVVPAARQLWQWFTQNIVPALRTALQPALDGARGAFESIRSAIDRNRPTIDALRRNFDRLQRVLGPLARFLAGPVARAVGQQLGRQFRILGQAIGFVIDLVAFGVRAFDRLASAASRAASAARGVGRFLGFSAGGADPDGAPFAGFSAGGPPAFMTAQLRVPGIPGQLPGVTGGGTGAAIVQNKYEVTVNGALDPVAVGQQLERILGRSARTQGRVTAGFGVTA